MCTASGGNPLAKVIWYKNDAIADESYTTSGRESRNTYTFVATTEDDDARFKCEARNEHSAEAKTAEIVLAVQCEYSRNHVQSGVLEFRH